MPSSHLVFFPLDSGPPYPDQSHQCIIHPCPSWQEEAAPRAEFVEEEELLFLWSGMAVITSRGPRSPEGANSGAARSAHCICSIPGCPCGCSFRPHDPVPPCLPLSPDLPDAPVVPQLSLLPPCFPGPQQLCCGEGDPQDPLQHLWLPGRPPHGGRILWGDRGDQGTDEKERRHPTSPSSLM